jgi:DNA helicase-2/ATP-dependent DNA helicase PcrA
MMPSATAETIASSEASLLADLTDVQRDAVTHDRGPLLIVAGAGTGKTTVITRRIAWLITTQRAEPSQILALTFTDKAAAEMEDRVDRLLPYGMTEVRLSTFHAFGDRVLREHPVEAGVSATLRVLSAQEQQVVLREHLFQLPLDHYRPVRDPAQYLEALIRVFGKAKDEAILPEEFMAFAEDQAARAEASGDDDARRDASRVLEVARCYAAYQQLLRARQAIDFGDQVSLAVRLFEHHPHLRQEYQRRYAYILVDEFQDTNWAQYRLLQLLAPPGGNVTVVADDDQSIYKWRGAAISNVLKFLEHYAGARRIVLTQNFRSSQAILDASYRLVRHNDPDRLEVKERIDKRLVAMCPREAIEPTLAVFDTVSSEADWVARQIQSRVEAGRNPGEFAILVRTNREADMFLRALNVCGLPWSFSGAQGLFAREEGKLLLSCLKSLADPEDSLSAYHVLSSPLYECPMAELVACSARARRTNRSLRTVVAAALEGAADVTAGADGDGSPPAITLGEPAAAVIRQFLDDSARLTEQSRTQSPGQLLYRWLTDRGWLKQRAALERARDLEELQTVAQFFDQLRKIEELAGNRLPDFMAALDLFLALGDAVTGETDSAAADRVNVMTIHKAKGLEFPVVFLVGLVQGRFPTPLRRDPIELPDGLIKDILPAGDYHLQEERRLFYVAMTRAKEELFLTASYNYGGKSVRKLSQFVLEALAVPAASPPAAVASIAERIDRAKPSDRPPVDPPVSRPPEPLRLDAHGVDDYLTCPLKYRYSHLLKIPIMRHHLVIYGSALHRAVEVFFKGVLAGRGMSEEELLAVFAQAWSSEGFLSREHETQRLEQGRATLQRFYAQQQRAHERPTLIEEKFTIKFGGVMLTGRWDRVDTGPEGAVMIDYKSSNVTEQDDADKRARTSLQMQVYALAWRALRGRLPTRAELRFLETGFVGTASFSDKDLEKTEAQLLQTAQGIRAMEFRPRPTEFACRWCAYQTICPSSAA